MSQQNAAAPPLRQMRVHLVAVPMHKDDLSPSTQHWESALHRLVDINPPGKPLRSAEILNVHQGPEGGVIDLRLGMDADLVPVLSDDAKQNAQLSELDETVAALMMSAANFAEDDVRTAQIQRLAWNWEGEERMRTVAPKDGEAAMMAAGQRIADEQDGRVHAVTPKDGERGDTDKQDDRSPGPHVPA